MWNPDITKEYSEYIDKAGGKENEVIAEGLRKMKTKITQYLYFKYLFDLENNDFEKAQKFWKGTIYNYFYIINFFFAYIQCIN